MLFANAEPVYAVPKNRISYIYKVFNGLPMRVVFPIKNRKMNLRSGESAFTPWNVHANHEAISVVDPS